MRFILLAAIVGRLYAVVCSPDAAEFKTGRAAYYRAIEGDKDALERSARSFSQLHVYCPADAVTTVYFGSISLLQAAKTWAVWKKNSLSKEGIQAMDTAVKAAPENLEVRFVRAATTYNLPDFFHRKQQSEDDFAFLAHRAVQAAREGKFDPRLAAASLYFHAEFLHDDSKDKQAIESWKLAIRIAPHSRAAQDAANELKKRE